MYCCDYCVSWSCGLRFQSTCHFIIWTMDATRPGRVDLRRPSPPPPHPRLARVSVALPPRPCSGESPGASAIVLRAFSLGLLNLRSWPFGILSPPPHWERSGSGKRCAAARWSQGIVSPPSTDRLCPVTAFDASEAKKTHACVCVWQRRLLECRRLCYSLFDAPPFSGGPAVPPLDLLLSVGR